MIEPYYQIFKEKLKEVKFKDMKTLFPTVDKFVKEVNPDLEKNGLLCPIVLDKDGKVSARILGAVSRSLLTQIVDEVNNG